MFVGMSRQRDSYFSATCELSSIVSEAVLKSIDTNVCRWQIDGDSYYVQF